LFEDVVPQFQRWHAQGVQLAIYSSGSVPAQKLLFRHVADGQQQQDVTPLLSAYFDTVNAGKKTEPASYETILGALGRAPSEVLFLSDVPAGT
jgi:enolase-phosphatase E1